jgi:hypothetical protein
MVTLIDLLQPVLTLLLLAGALAPVVWIMTQAPESDEATDGL